MSTYRHVRAFAPVSLVVLLAVCVLLDPRQAAAQNRPQSPADQTPALDSPSFLADRGTGIATSMFATYVRPGELLLYPFFEHYRDGNFEYKPSEFGATGAGADTDYRGRFRADEVLLFVAYGISDRLAVEAEAALERATFEKAPGDPTALASRVHESGLGDVEGQVRWRWRRETASRPEVFSFAEAVAPHHRDRPLIGTSGVELKFGTGVTRGFRWGTMTGRAGVEYAASSSSRFDLGEYALEYVKRLSPRWRVYGGVEGAQDQLSLVAEVQWHLRPNVFVRLNNGFGVTSKATDWAPEVGMVFSLGGGR
jgi:hypothetical protein